MLKHHHDNSASKIVRNLLLAAGLLTSGVALADPGLPASIRKSMKLNGIDASELGVAVIAESDGKVRFSHFPKRPMSPASTMKTLTTIAALDTLGPDFRWKTALLAQNLVQNQAQDGVLKGALFLRGGAEPNLSWDKLGLMLRALRDKGISRIDGDLIVDRSLFNPSRPDQNVAPFDSTPTQYYNVIPDPMLVNANLIDLNLTSDESHVTVHFSPPLDGVEIVSQLQTDDEGCTDWDEEWPVPQLVSHDDNPTVILHGTYPRNCTNQTSTNILDRNIYIERLIRSLWHELGGQWNGKVRDGVTPAEARVLVERVSEPLSDIVKIINKRSDNTMARDLYLTLGVQQGSGDSRLTSDRSQQAVRGWLQSQHIDDTGLVLENGSGLSRIERISPLQLASVLRAAAASNWSAEFKSSLPIAGVDGTMARRGAAIAPGTARIKGGTLNNTAAIAGYVSDQQGKHWIIVAMINRPDAAKGRVVLDSLLSWVASHPAKSSQPAFH